MFRFGAAPGKVTIMPGSIDTDNVRDAFGPMANAAAEMSMAVAARRRYRQTCRATRSMLPPMTCAASSPVIPVLCSADASACHVSTGV
jgi:NAD(P)-dependent dehydrogenase (short-subunit alcohol dehydrogenase family)